MSAKPVLKDPALFTATMALISQPLNNEKRWKGVIYMPAQYAETVQEHILSTKSTASTVLHNYHGIKGQALQGAINHHIDLHDVPEALGEFLTGGQEKYMRDNNIDLYPTDLKTFSFIFRAAENAALSGNDKAFMQRIDILKNHVLSCRLKDVALVDPKQTLHCFKVLNSEMDIQNKFLTDDADANNYAFAKHYYEGIENDALRKNNFAANVAKIFEKNDAYVHMARTYGAMRAHNQSDAIPFAKADTDSVMRFSYRTTHYAGDLIRSAGDDMLQKKMAKDTLSFVYGTTQQLLKYGPDYIDLSQKQRGPSFTDSNEAHAAFQANLKSQYDAQNPDRPETHIIISKEDAILRLEAAKETLLVPAIDTAPYAQDHYSAQFLTNLSVAKRKQVAKAILI